jgi:hypothetical protein
VTPINDTLPEPDETVVITVLPGTGYDPLAPTSATGTIVDNDTPPTISITDAAILEADRKTSPVTLTILLSRVFSTAVTITVTTVNGSASAPGDYTALNTTISIPSGSLSATVTIQIVNDTTIEPQEQFFVNLSNPSAGTFTDSQGLVTITDNDGALRAGATGSNEAPTRLDSGTARAALALAAATWGSALQGVDLSTVSIEIADLPFDLLAQTSPDGTTILIDIDAAGWGWSTDVGAPVGAASIDLLSVLAHELGHVLGLEHGTSELMGELIQPGSRELPELTATTDPVAAPATVSLTPVTRSVDAAAALVPRVDLVLTRTALHVASSARGVLPAVETAIARPALERAGWMTFAGSPISQDGTSPMMPATTWWLLIGLGMALATLRRRRLLHAAHR